MSRNRFIAITAYFQNITKMFKKSLLSCWNVKSVKTYIFTSQTCSWLQNGQLNCVSRGTIGFTFGGGFLFDFRLPIMKISQNTF